jgi:hypothetical protein
MFSTTAATARKWQRVTKPTRTADQCRLLNREIMEVGEEWSLDTIGPLEPDEDGSQYMMVAVDGLSRCVMLEPAKDATGESQCSTFSVEDCWYVRSDRVPKGIRTDEGSQYS